MKPIEKPVYILAQFNIKSYDLYRQNYILGVRPLLQKYQAEILVTSPKSEILEGDKKENYTAILKFPSKELALAWYNCPEYQPFKTIRINELTNGGSLQLLEAFE